MSTSEVPLSALTQADLDRGQSIIDRSEFNSNEIFVNEDDDYYAMSLSLFGKDDTGLLFEIADSTQQTLYVVGENDLDALIRMMHAVMTNYLSKP
jgi:hypothetical protein